MVRGLKALDQNAVVSTHPSPRMQSSTPNCTRLVYRYLIPAHSSEGGDGLHHQGRSYSLDISLQTNLDVERIIRITIRILFRNRFVNVPF